MKKKGQISGMIESTKKIKKAVIEIYIRCKLKTIQTANIGQHRQGSFVTIFC